MPCLKVSPWLPAGLCLFYYLTPPNSFFPFLLAVSIHELGHILAILWVGGKITAAKLRLGGAVLESSPLTYGQELLCSLAGPFFGLFFGYLLRKPYPWLWFWGALHCIFNLLPIYPLDGGRALRAVLCRHLPLNQGETLSKAVSTVFFVGLTALCLFLPPAGKYAVLRLVPPLVLFSQIYGSLRQ